VQGGDTVTTYDGDDPDGYALAVNIARRHMSASQRAIVVARAVRLAGISQRDGAQRFNLNQARIGQANTVLDYAPDLADQVVAGLPLHEAYRTARERKQAAESTEAAMARLRAEAGPLSVPVLAWDDRRG
jgi:RNase H-fold protein (predicted Holliday junction resolvase)